MKAVATCKQVKTVFRSLILFVKAGDSRVVCSVCAHLVSFPLCGHTIIGITVPVPGLVALGTVVVEQDD